MANKIESSTSFIEGRGSEFCRGCLGNKLFSALDLGDLPIANELLFSQTAKIEKFPLHLKVCSDCGLGQVADVTTPERIFRDYRYLSSMSTTFLRHANDFVEHQIARGFISNEDWVLEIASNDGYLLKNFLSHGVRVIGVEPAENVADISRSLGIHTIAEFFSSKLATELLISYGFPKLIVANNVMAHVPDLIDFVKGLAILCGPSTQISIENPSLANILFGMQFDTIYHEHYSYLSASAVANISRMHSLQLYKVENLPIHGGTNRYWLEQFGESVVIDPSVEKECQVERNKGLFNPKEWVNYSNKVSNVLDDFLDWLRVQKRESKRVYGYGAAAKASTLLNSIGLEEGLIHAIFDLSLEKQNRFMPPHGIRIISPQELPHENPTDIVIFPWNISSEITSFLRSNLGDEVGLWCVVPEMKEVGR
jgi:hypothetical protein